MASSIGRKKQIEKKNLYMAIKREREKVKRREWVGKVDKRNKEE